MAYLGNFWERGGRGMSGEGWTHGLDDWTIGPSLVCTGLDCHHRRRDFSWWRK